MLGTCKNGHITGYRHCGTCGADRIPAVIGTGSVIVPRHKIDRDRDTLRKMRRDTAIRGGGHVHPTPAILR